MEMDPFRLPKQSDGVQAFFFLTERRCSLRKICQRVRQEQQHVRFFRFESFCCFLLTKLFNLLQSEFDFFIVFVNLSAERKIIYMLHQGRFRFLKVLSLKTCSASLLFFKIR